MSSGMLFENESLNIPNYSIEEVMKMLYKHHYLHWENKDMNFDHSKREINYYSKK